MRRATITTAAVVSAVAVAGAATQATGSSGPTATAAKTTTLRLKADAGGQTLRFNKKTLKARRGTVRIVMKNVSKSLPHAVAIEGRGVDKDGKTAGPGKTSTVSARLKKGRYEFYCPVGNHEQAGMKGTLIVR